MNTENVIYAPIITITTGTICNGVHEEYRTEEELRRANPQVPLDVIKEFTKSYKNL